MSPADGTAPRRRPEIDALRGLALVAMALFHLTWDLAHFGWIRATITQSPAFHRLGDAIAASFLLLVGVSLVLARQAGALPLLRARKFWRRWLILAAACAAISAASFALFPQSPIFFGILHCIALASLLAAPLVEAPAALTLTLGLGALAAPHILAAPVFNQPALWWTGLSPVEPASNDFRPLLPWLGVALLGVALGKWRVAASAPSRFRHVAAPKMLSFLGRHSLAIYLVHQPALFGLFSALAMVAVGPETGRRFIEQCNAQCATEASDPDLCQRTCLCLVHSAQHQGLWAPLANNDLNERQKIEVQHQILACFGASQNR